MDHSQDAKDPDFLRKAKDTYNIHAANLREHDNWTIAKTAKSLGRSPGMVSQELMIVRWWRIHPVKIEKFTNVKDCLEWIRDKEKEQEVEKL